MADLEQRMIEKYNNLGDPKYKILKEQENFKLACKKGALETAIYQDHCQLILNIPTDTLNLIQLIYSANSFDTLVTEIGKFIQEGTRTPTINHIEKIYKKIKPSESFEYTLTHTLRYIANINCDSNIRKQALSYIKNEDIGKPSYALAIADGILTQDL